MRERRREYWIKFRQNIKDNFSEYQVLFYSAIKTLRKEYTMRNIKDRVGNIITEENKIMKTEDNISRSEWKQGKQMKVVK